MPSLRKTLNLPYAANDLFDLVSDVRSYPDFIKWIRAIRVSDEQTEPERWRARADAAIMFKGISERFVTNVDARRD
ncbi:MAG: SRPBCC family protein, partial [Pseudomonadota bacterium]